MASICEGLLDGADCATELPLRLRALAEAMQRSLAAENRIKLEPRLSAWCSVERLAHPALKMLAWDDILAISHGRHRR